MEFAKLIGEQKKPDDEVALHLVTANNEDYIQNAKQAFAEMMDSLDQLGIKFTYEFSDVQHDRSIELSNGWKIILGRD